MKWAYKGSHTVPTVDVAHGIFLELGVDPRGLETIAPQTPIISINNIVKKLLT